MILIQDGNYLENLSRDKIIEVLLISLICILIVFLILTLIIGVCSLSTKGVEIVNAKTHINPKEETKKQILDNELFRKYKEKETDLNILILKINSELKQITKKDKCGL